MKISFIITVYNNYSECQKTLNSIFALSAFCEYEIIVVDDGSKEVDSLLFPENVIVRQYKINNSGPLNARIIGISFAQGDYIVIVDSGDEIMIDNFSLVYEIINLNKDIYFIDAIVCRDNKSYNLFQMEESRIIDKAIFLKHLIKGEAGYTCSVIVKTLIAKQSAKKILNAERIIFTEDQFLNLNFAIEANSFMTIKDPIYRYNVSESSLATGISKQKIDSYIFVLKYKYSLFCLEGYFGLGDYFLENELFGFLRFAKSCTKCSDKGGYLFKQICSDSNCMSFYFTAKKKFSKTLPFRYRLFLKYIDIKIRKYENSRNHT